MADAYRYQQQGAGTFFLQQHTQSGHHPRHLLRSGTPPTNIRSAYNETPSPSRSPDNQSPAPHHYGMFTQGHQQTQHGRVNGGPGGRGMPMMYNFQHQNAHAQNHGQHHGSMGQEHGTNGLAHHGGFASGVLSNATPNFTPSSLQNGHFTATTRGGQAQQITEHWAEQLKLHKESERAHITMIDQHAPHHYARMKAGENKGIQPSVTAASPKANSDGKVEDRGRPSNTETTIKRQDWHNMDLSGQGLRVLATPCFGTPFQRVVHCLQQARPAAPVDWATTTSQTFGRIEQHVD